jgi:hypothetical protein
MDINIAILFWKEIRLKGIQSPKFRIVGIYMGFYVSTNFDALF